MRGSNLGSGVEAAVWLSDPLNHLDGAINLGLQSQQRSTMRCQIIPLAPKMCEIEMVLFLTSTTRAEPAVLQFSPKATLVPKVSSSSSSAEAVHTAKKLLRLIFA